MKILSAIKNIHKTKYEYPVLYGISYTNTPCAIRKGTNHLCDMLYLGDGKAENKSGFNKNATIVPASWEDCCIFGN
jgi:hypothetical protein